MEINRGYIDLGLPSGLLWAKCNIGANSPEDGGLYFQWGDVQGYTAEQVGTDKMFSNDWVDYRFGTLDNVFKYNDTDNKDVLDPEDDAVHILMGGNWRLPTQEDFVELVNNTDIFLALTSGEEIRGTVQAHGDYPVYFEFAATAETCTGMKFYKKGDHSTYLFVPASGDAFAGSVQRSGVNGVLWSSSFDSSVVEGAWHFGFYAPYGVGGVVDEYRCVGTPLRGVRQK